MTTMPQELPTAHCASVLCQVTALDALEFMADGQQLGRWALGCWDTTPVVEDMVRGRSLFDDHPSWVRPVADRTRMTVIYHVGSAPDALSPRIRATVEPVEAVETQGEAPCCRISLHAERSPDMDDARWLRLMRCHEVEVLLIQARLAPPQRPPGPLHS